MLDLDRCALRSVGNGNSVRRNYIDRQRAVSEKLLFVNGGDREAVNRRKHRRIAFQRHFGRAYRYHGIFLCKISVL